MADEKPKPKNGRRKTAKTEPELLFEDGYWWIINGTVRVNAGRSERYARNLLAEQQAK